MMAIASDQSFLCPKCGESIKLTESIAAPLVAATRAHYEEVLSAQATRYAEDKKAVDALKVAVQIREVNVETAARNQAQQIALAVQQQLEQKVALAKKTISQEEALRARQGVSDVLEALTSAGTLKDQRIAAMSGKLRIAQAAQAEVIEMKLQLQDQEREFSLSIQKGIAAGLTDVRNKAMSEAHSLDDLRIKDRDNTISDLSAKIVDLHRKAEQGSQQAQGETLEVLLEAQLHAEFPFDVIESVGKGEFGGDVLQHLRDSSGKPCGKILWESKRTKNWSDGWLAKLKKDQRAANAELGVIVSQTMPKDVTYFEQIDGIWVSSVSCILPVANALHFSLIELANLRRSTEGQDIKAQQIYTCLTGPTFKGRVECIAEKFTELRHDLDSERKWMTKQWSKRDRELTIVLEATSGMYGDLQGIAGRNLHEIAALEGPMLLKLGN